MKESLERAAELIESAGAILIGAGAGMGVDSGLPDFRGDQGFWKAYPPLRDLGISFVDMANPHWFQKDPRLAWGFYGHRLNLYRSIQPHRGFQLLLNWSRACRQGGFVFTSNVDGQFQKAGFSDNQILECHGSIHYIQCMEGCDGIWESDTTHIQVDEKVMRAMGNLPTCPQCGGLARPNILMFGDWGWLDQREHNQNQRFIDWIQGLTEPPVLIECGAGSAVPTVRATMENVARQTGGSLIRINPVQDQVPVGQISLKGNALSVLESLESLLGK